MVPIFLYFCGGLIIGGGLSGCFQSYIWRRQRQRIGEEIPLQDLVPQPDPVIGSQPDPVIGSQPERNLTL
jgi:hypothetical protein